MKETSPRWRPIAPSEHPWERDALAFLRAGLPDHDPYVVWSNLEFVAEDGHIHEVDALVLTPKGFFLVEIKSWPGVLEGDASTWKLQRDGQTRTFDSPLLGANRKARKLASLLRRQKAAKSARLPIVEPIVFLSHPELRSRLTGSARQGVHSRESLIAALTKFEPAGRYPSGQPAPPAQVRIYRPVAQAVERAVAEAGIRPSQRMRRVGDYILEDLLYAGPNYQDWQARHANSSRIRPRRVRIYPVATAAGAEARAQLQRAARREMEVLEGLSHPALLKPQHLTEHELGPALVFEHNPEALRLDHYLAQQGSRLGFAARLALIRQIAEALQYAHDKRVFHRALSPQSILVWNPESDSPDLRILNWQAAAQEALTTQAGSSGTSHLDDLVEDASRVYLAPESLSLADAAPETLDVFSLGAVAFFILSGQPPAPSVLELHDRLREGKGLQLAAAVDGADADLAALIELATDPVVARRIASISDFLQLLEGVEKDLPRTDPDEIAENPHDARTGDRLDGGFLVKSRLGKGSTSSVFLVDRDGKEEVLKLALDPEADERLRAEAEVLKGLSHPRIVQFLDTATVSGRFGILLSWAGEGTLAQRLRREGRLQLELLQRFGEDLLETVDYLERTGVPHRDIKPDNLGVTKAGRNDELHLVLFDFSLTRTRAENIFAGTRPYLDPFLRERKPRRWDLQAERFAAAVTLYEMATGVLPRWGDGLSDPAMIEDEAHIEAELLDAAVRSSLSDFFRQALRRNPRQRFDNAQEMLAAWSRAFAGTDRPATTTAEEQPDELARACAQASLETPVSLLHLSTRAVNALERAQVATVHDLLRIPVSRLNRLRGVGSKTRKELLNALERLTERFGPQPAPPEPAPAPSPDAEPTVVGLDLLVRRILPGRSSATGERRILETLFGLDAEAGPLYAWPSQTETAEALDLTRARVSQILVKARQRWRRDRSLTLLRDHIAGLLEAHGGAMSHEELCAALLATRGSVQEEPLRTRHAAAVLRAATEAEEGGRWVFRREEARRDSTSRRVLFGIRLDDQPEALLDYADALGRKADELAGQDPLPSPQRALEILQDVTRPAALPPLSGERLLRLATAASRTAALSSRLEIYPQGLKPERALRLASGTLLGARELTVQAVRERLGSRFPKAAPLPNRPQLDDLLEQSIGLTWYDDRGAYRFPDTQATTFTSTTLQRGRTTFNPQVGAEPSAEEVDLRIFEERLQRADREGAFLALVVPERSLTDAEEILARRFPSLRIHSLEALWLRAMRQLADEKRVRWDLVLRSDALPPGHPDARNLQSFVRLALDRVEAELAPSPHTILLTRAGLLARYGEMGFLDRLRDRVSRRPAPGETGLHGFWLLLPTAAETAGPQIENEPVDVPTPAHWTRVPRAWLRAHALKETA